MITREWILWVVTVLQIIPLLVLVWWVFTQFSLGVDPGLAAEIGGSVLLLWVTISHLLLLRRYKFLRNEKLND